MERSRQDEGHSVGISEDEPYTSQNLAFVGGLPLDANEEDLCKYFGTFGLVLAGNIRRSTKGKSKGFGFIQFKDRKHLDLVLAHSPHIILGTVINVQPALDPVSKKREQDARTERKIFVGNIPGGKTSNDVMIQISKVGTVEKITNLRSRNDGTFYCYVILENYSDAQKLLQMKRLTTDDGMNIKFKEYHVNSTPVLEQQHGMDIVHGVLTVERGMLSFPTHPPAFKFGPEVNRQTKAGSVWGQRDEPRQVNPTVSEDMQLQTQSRTIELLPIRRHLRIEGLPSWRRKRQTCSLDFQKSDQSHSRSAGPRSHSSEDSTYRFNVGRSHLQSGLQ